MNKSFGITLATIFTIVGLSHADPTPKPKPDSSGKSVVGGPAREYVFYAPRPDYSYDVRSQRLTGSGVFVVNVRPDGTVSSVEIFKSTGHRELDNAAITAFAKWRFRPGTISKAKIPVTFSMRRR